MEAGYKVQHEPSSIVYHSHDYSLAELLQRHFDDGLANRDIVGREFDDDDLVPMIFDQVREDWRYLREDCGLDDEDLEHWQITAVLRRVAGLLGEWLGVNNGRWPIDLIPLLSLTERIKAGSRTEAQRAGGT
jgi:hypothetical protein